MPLFYSLSRLNGDISIFTACAPTRSLSLRIGRSHPSSRVPTHAALLTTILYLEFLLNSSTIRPAFVDIIFFALLTNIRLLQLVDSSLDEYEPTDSETDYHLGSETELTDVSNNINEVIEDAKDAE